MTRVAILLLCLLLPAPGQAEQEYRIGMPCVTTECQLPPLGLVVGEAYRRLGRKAIFQPLPSLRELEYANVGITDGCLVRTPSVAKDYPELVQVPFPLLRNRIVACSVRDDVEVPNQEALRQYRVGILRGSILVGLICKRVGLEPVVYNQVGNGLKMLQEGRIDMVLEEQILARIAAENLAMTLRYSQPLHHGYYYHWLHRRHAPLARELAATLREMSKDGTTRRLLGRFAEAMPDPDLED